MDLEEDEELNLTQEELEAKEREEPQMLQYPACGHVGSLSTLRR